MKLILNCHSTNEFGEGCDYAFLDLTPELASEILRRKDLWDNLHASDRDLDELVELNAVVHGDVAQRLGRNIAGQNDAGNLSIEELAQAPRNLDPRHTIRQIVIGKDDVRRGRPARDPAQRARPVDRGRDAVAFVAHDRRQMAADFGIVLDHENMAPGSRLGCRP